MFTASNTKPPQSNEVDTEPRQLSEIDPQEDILSDIDADLELADIPSVDDEQPRPFFRAIGTLKGKIEKDEEKKFWLCLGQNKYRLFIPGYKYLAWLKEHENKPDSSPFLRVYPKYRIIPRKPPEIYFQVVAWAEENIWSEPGIFTLQGVWQFIPQLRTPVISVYRNKDAVDPIGKFSAAHIPVLMRREDDTRPFKFNPKIPKEDLPPRWFIQSVFKFIPSRECWGWVEDIEPPTQRIPRYQKPIKEAPDANKPGQAEHKSYDKGQAHSKSDRDSAAPQKRPGIEESTSEGTKSVSSHPKPKPVIKVVKDSSESVSAATESQAVSKVETESSTPVAATESKTVSKVEKESSTPMILSRSEMIEKLEISESTFYKRMTQAKKETEPPILECDGQRWAYVDNANGKGKVFQLIKDGKS
ncbi:hypothetical protein [Aphanothece sacrum]|uniref:Uncharacterized protein n=1 Tax=Aphanothece sacrum FPU1 TaxID=1920663 RepID=A0A401IHW1_APHSA|nr:hypothetical protein AsFPU1_2224 [Aphanothece sacrum FPU1]GBF83314.1 hypothetical protein AsFPU3_0354 [Aphanothece sacrum FPU3]